jgi:hypothetical protein
MSLMKKKVKMFFPKSKIFPKTGLKKQMLLVIGEKNFYKTNPHKI